MPRSNWRLNSRSSTIIVVYDAQREPIRVTFRSITSREFPIQFWRAESYRIQRENQPSRNDRELISFSPKLTIFGITHRDQSSHNSIQSFVSCSDFDLSIQKVSRRRDFCLSCSSQFQKNSFRSSSCWSIIQSEWSLCCVSVVFETLETEKYRDWKMSFPTLSDSRLVLLSITEMENSHWLEHFGIVEISWSDGDVLILTDWVWQTARRLIRPHCLTSTFGDLGKNRWKRS